MKMCDATRLLRYLGLVFLLAAGARLPGGQITAFVEPNAGRAPLIEAFERARKSIDIFAFVLSDDPIAASLAKAVARGVTVRVLLEPCSGERDCKAPLEEAVAACSDLVERRIQVKWANPAFAKTHAKMMVVDGARAFITSINLEAQSFTSRRDYGLITDDPRAIADFNRAFAQDWQNDPPLKSCSQKPSARRADKAMQRYDTLIVSPDHGREQILGLIRSAHSSLKIQMEQIGKSLVPPLADAVKSGVHVQVLMAQKKGRDRTENAAAALQAAGAEARFQKRPKLHAKLIVVDGQRLFLGSQNLTKTSLDERREIGWVTADAAAVACFQRVFDADWAGKDPGLANGACPQAPPRPAPAKR
jgi:cardiolipin synthase